MPESEIANAKSVGPASIEAAVTCLADVRLTMDMLKAGIEAYDDFKNIADWDPGALVTEVFYRMLAEAAPTSPTPRG